MDTFPHWWDGWVITNAPAALESPGTLSGLATTDKGVLTAWNNALKILEDYHTTGAVAQARRLQTEAKVWSDLFAARNKMLTSLAMMQGDISETQIKALQRQQEALLQARTALATRAATGDQATVAQVRATYTTQGVDSALSSITPVLEASALLSDSDVGNAALPATVSGALQAANVDITDLYEIDEATFRQRLRDAGSQTPAAQTAAVGVWQRAKQTFGTLSDLDRTIDEDLRVVSGVFGPDATGEQIANAALAASKVAEKRLEERLPGFDDVAVAQLQQDALDTLEGYRLTKEAAEFYRAAATTEKPSQQDQLAASPAFQAWAREHGFPNVGTTDADGNFTPGFDDYDATAEYIKQVLRKKPPMMGKHAGRDEYVKFEETIEDGSPSAVAFDEAHQYAGKYVKDKETGKFLTREEIEARVAPPVMFVHGKEEGVEFYYNEGSDVAIRYSPQGVTSVPIEAVEGRSEPERAAIVEISGNQVAVRPMVGRLRAGSDAEAQRQVTALLDEYGGFTSFSDSMKGAVAEAEASGLQVRREESAYAPVDIAREMRVGYRTPRNVMDGEVFTDPRKPDDKFRYRIVDGKAEYSEDGGPFRPAANERADAAIREVADFIKKPAAQADADPDALDPLDSLDPLTTDKSLEIVSERPKQRTVMAIRKPTPAKYALQAAPDEAIVVDDAGEMRIIKRQQIVESVPVDGIVGRGGQGELRATFGEPADPNAAIRFSGRSEASKERAKAERVERQKERFERQAAEMSPEQLAAEADVSEADVGMGQTDARVTPDQIAALAERAAQAAPPTGTPLPSQRLAGLESRIEDERKRVRAEIAAEQPVPLSSMRRIARLTERADAVRARAPQPSPDAMLDAAVAQRDVNRAATAPVGAPGVRETQTPAQLAVGDIQRVQQSAAESKRQRILAASNKGPDEVVRVTDRLRAYFRGDRAATRERSLMERRAFRGANTLPEVTTPERRDMPEPAGRRALPGLKGALPNVEPRTLRESVVGDRSVDETPAPPRERPAPVEKMPNPFDDATRDGGGADLGAVSAPGGRDVFKRLMGGKRGDAIPMPTANQRTRIA